MPKCSGTVDSERRAMTDSALTASHFVSCHNHISAVMKRAGAVIAECKLISARRDRTDSVGSVSRMSRSSGQICSSSSCTMSHGERVTPPIFYCGWLWMACTWPEKWLQLPINLLRTSSRIKFFLSRLAVSGLSPRSDSCRHSAVLTSHGLYMLFISYLKSFFVVFSVPNHLPNASFIRRAQYFWSQTDCAVSLQTPDITTTSVAL